MQGLRIRLLLIAAVAGMVFTVPQARAQILRSDAVEQRNSNAAAGYTRAQLRLYIERLKRIKRAIGDTSPIDAGQFVDLPRPRDILLEVRPPETKRKLSPLQGGGQFVLGSLAAKLTVTDFVAIDRLNRLVGANQTYIANGRRAAILLDLPTKLQLTVSGVAQQVTPEPCTFSRIENGLRKTKRGRRDVIGPKQIFTYLPGELANAATITSGNGITLTDDGFYVGQAVTGQVESVVTVAGGSVLNRTLRRGCTEQLPERQDFKREFKLGGIALAHVSLAGLPRKDGALGVAQDNATDFFVRRGGSQTPALELAPQMEATLGESSVIMPIPRSKFRVVSTTGGYTSTRNSAGFIVTSPATAATGAITIQTIDGELPAAVHRLTTNEMFPLALSTKRVRVGEQVSAAVAIVGDADMSQYVAIWEAGGLAPKTIETGFEKSGAGWASVAEFTAESGILQEFKDALQLAKDTRQSDDPEPAPGVGLAKKRANILVKVVRKSDRKSMIGTSGTVEVVPEITAVRITGGYTGERFGKTVDLFNPPGEVPAASFRAEIDIAAGAEKLTFTSQDARIGRLVRLQATRGAPFTIRDRTVAIANPSGAPIGAAAVRGVIRLADALGIAGLVLPEGQDTLFSDPVRVTVNRLTQAHFVTPGGKRELTVGVLGPADMGRYQAVWALTGSQETSKPFSQDKGGFIAKHTISDFRLVPSVTDVRLGGVVVGRMGAAGGAERDANVAAIVALEAPALIQGKPLKVRARLANVPKPLWPRLYCAWSVDSIYGKLAEPESAALMNSTFNGVCENTFTLRETLATIDETPNLEVELRIRQGTLK